MRLDSPSAPLSAVGTKRAALPGDVRAAQTPISALPHRRARRAGAAGEEGAGVAVLRGGTAPARLLRGLSERIGAYRKGSREVS